MKSVNLLPRNIVEQIEVKKILLRYTAGAAVIFLLFVLFVYIMDVSAGIILAETESYTNMLLDEKYEYSDRIAAELNERLADGDNRPGLAELTEIVRLDLDALVFLGEIMREVQGGGKFVSPENIIYDSTGAIEITAIASDRELISGLVRRLYGTGVFSGIDVPQITGTGGGNFRFKLFLAAAGIK